MNCSFNSNVLFTVVPLNVFTTICQPPIILVTIRENQHILNFSPTQHLTNFLPTYCFYVRAASTFQHLTNIIPIQNSTHMLHTDNLLQSTFPQHHPHIASIVAPQAKQRYFVGMGRIWVRH